jgi:hypothetical protein
MPRVKNEKSAKPYAAEHQKEERGDERGTGFLLHERGNAIQPQEEADGSTCDKKHQGHHVHVIPIAPIRNMIRIFLAKCNSIQEVASRKRFGAVLLLLPAR